MTATEAAMAVLRQDVLRRIPFTFPGGGGFFSVGAGVFAQIADRMAPGAGGGAGLTVRIDPTLAFAGDFTGDAIVLRDALPGRRAQSALCHEALHAHLYYSDAQGVVYDNYEEAACYTVNALYYLLTDWPQSRWAEESAAILQAALPVAQAILGANAARPHGYIVSPREFEPLVAAVATAYPDNNSHSSYERRAAAPP